MTSIFTRFSGNFLLRTASRHQPHARSNISTPTGAIPPKPAREFLGITKLVIITIPFLYLGGMISMHGASFLEDYDIFVPEDDDDDD